VHKPGSTIPVNKNNDQLTMKPSINQNAIFHITYGLYLLTAREDNKDNGCIINTVNQIANNPARISVSVNKLNLTHDMIKSTGEFNVSILTDNTPFEIFDRFGYNSGKDKDKFAEFTDRDVSANAVIFLTKYSNSFISGKVIESFDYGTHTLFIAEITEAEELSNEPSMTYQHYIDNVKPKPQSLPDDKNGFICKICGYFYEGDVLPDDIVCPLCKHGKDDFLPNSYC
jgi:flavin reductase (DIM6/NTAB) family NADH-FMN oxidoreductase RutF